MKRILLASFSSLLLLLLGGLAAPARAVEFPRPSSLDPAVRFWTRIYAEVDTSGGLIHDSRELGVVYEVVRFPSGLSSRGRERHTEKRKRVYRDILRKLASGRRTGLSAEQERVLALWPEGVSNDTLRAASGRTRFQLGQADKFRAGIIRSGAYKGYIRQVFSDMGLPPDLSALPHVESSYTPHAYSRIGAAGLWQFTASTGRRFMRVDHVLDERLDPEQATIAAARLLQQNYNVTGAWPLAITAYNHGASGMRRAVRKLGTRDIDVIVRKYRSRTFGFASRNFYAEFLAARDVDRNAEQHFGPLRLDVPTAYETIELPFYAPARSLARALGVDVTVLQDSNPALRESIWNGSKRVPRGYAVRVPRDQLAKPIAQALEQLPTSERYARQTRDSIHKVRRGETLSAIARRYGVSTSQLVSLNGLHSRHRIYVGQKIRLPDAGGRSSVAVARAEPPMDGVYTVRRGDTLSRIASRYGLDEPSLMAANGLRNRHRIYAGQTLRVSTTAAATPDPPVAPTPPSTGAVADGTPPVEPAAGATPGPTLGDVPVEDIPATVGIVEGVEVAEVEPEIESVAETEAETEPADETELADETEPADETELADEPELAESDATQLAAAEALDAAPELTSPEPARHGARDSHPEAVAALSEPSAREPLVSADAHDAGDATAPNADAILADPTDYSVGSDGRIEVQAMETLGHYADWLGVRASRLRSINRMKYGTPVVIGSRIRLDFAGVSPEAFERLRIEYHRALQEEFFDRFEIEGTREHVMRRGDSIWALSQHEYRVPIWLMRQYNPDLDFEDLHAGMRITIPRLKRRETISG